MAEVFVILIAMYLIGGLIFMWKNLPMIMLAQRLGNHGSALAIYILIKTFLIWPKIVIDKHNFKKNWMKTHSEY